MVNDHVHTGPSKDKNVHEGQTGSSLIFMEIKSIPLAFQSIIYQNRMYPNLCNLCENKGSHRSNNDHTRKNEL